MEVYRQSGKIKESFLTSPIVVVVDAEEVVFAVGWKIVAAVIAMLDEDLQ